MIALAFKKGSSRAARAFVHHMKQSSIPPVLNNESPSAASALCVRRGGNTSTLLLHQPVRMLSEALTPEKRHELAGKFTRKKFKLAALHKELEFLEDKKFPLPESLSDDQWKQIMQFDHRKSRILYLDEFFMSDQKTCSEERFKELLAQDQDFNGPLRMEQEIWDELIGDNQDMLERVEFVKTIHQEMRLQGDRVLPTLPLADWRGVLDPVSEPNGLSKKKVAKALSFNVQRSDAKLLELTKKRARVATGEEKKAEVLAEREQNNHIIYGLAHNCMFFRFSTKAMERVDDYKVIREFHEWGQPLVIDLQFVKQMEFKRAKSLFYREIPTGLTCNRTRAEPFAIYLTSFDPNCHKCQILEKAFPRILRDPAYPVMVTEKHFSELFPQQDDRLLYLSPDSRNDLMKYNANDIYIIGGIVNQTGRGKETITAARQGRIRHARMPTTKYVGMHIEMNVDTAMQVMADFKNTRDWNYAFRWLPPRRFRTNLLGASYTVNAEAVYLAQKELCPASHPFDATWIQNMPKAEYYRRYKEIVHQVRSTVDDPSKHIPNTKYHSMNDKKLWRAGLSGDNNDDSKDMFFRDRGANSDN